MTPPLVQVERATKVFRSARGLFRRIHHVRAVDDVSLLIARGETVGLVGESGSGKSTLARLILGLLPLTGGRVRFDGTAVHDASAPALRALRRRMQVVFQDPFGALNPRMTAGAAVAEPLVVHRLASRADAPAQAVHLFDEVGLDAGIAAQYPHELSGGQRQRVVIARALAVSPEFLVLDEPVSSLDVSVQAQVLNLLADLREARGLTYLFISHDLAVVRSVADRIAVMYAGRIVETAPAAALCAEPRHPYTRVLLASVPHPDPGRRPARTAPPAEPPSTALPVSGCPFGPRCPHPRKDARCADEAPELREVEPGRWAGCHHAEGGRDRE